MFSLLINFKNVHFDKQGKRREDLTEEELLERENVGEQELTGHCRNNDRYVETEDSDPARYLTNYNMRQVFRSSKQ